MPDLATAFLDAKLVAELRERQRSPESRKRAADRRQAYDAPRGLRLTEIGCAHLSEDDTMPCFDPWLIAKAEPNREQAAYKSLRREGFEAWFPAGRKIKAMPRKRLSSWNRHKKRHVVVEDLRLPYAGYIFFRMLTQNSRARGLGRLWELEGVLGLCMFGESYGFAEDHEIQMLRFKEDIGAFDVWDVTMNAKEFVLADIRRTEAAKERWEKPPQLLGTLDTNRGGSLYLVEAFGRITRVVAATGDLIIAR
jgi:hypothetical protein